MVVLLSRVKQGSTSSTDKTPRLSQALMKSKQESLGTILIFTRSDREHIQISGVHHSAHIIILRCMADEGGVNSLEIVHQTVERTKNFEMENEYNKE